MPLKERINVIMDLYKRINGSINKKSAFSDEISEKSVLQEILHQILFDKGRNFGDYEKSLELYNKATEINPEEATAFILAGNLCSTLKDYDNAEAYYKKALHINKMDASLYVLIGNIYYMRGEVERSIPSYRAAVNIRPENDEYKLVFIQILNDYMEEARKDEIVSDVA